MIRAVVVALLAGVVAACPAHASFEETAVAWRPFGAAAFREARETGRPVFLVLTAPWTWDHFLLPDRLFADPEILDRLASDWIPVLADAEVFPELRSLYSIPSSLLPSFHFLDADGVAFASAAPLGREELAFRLDQWRDPAQRPAPEPVRARETIEINGDRFANRAARWLTELSERGELPVARVHEDLDPGALLFLAESGVTHVPRRTAETLAREISRLRSGPLADPVEGGFHRAFALPDTLPHFEKLLRINARIGRLLCFQFVRTRSVPVGRDALQVLRFLNEELRVGASPRYAASLAADVFDHAQHDLEETGAEHYAKGDPESRALSRPPVSRTVPAGGNFEVMSVLGTYATVFGDDRMVAAMGLAGPGLLADGLDPDGRARRVVGRPGPGTLLDQADAGLGLLALHGLTGSPSAWRAANRVAEGLLAHYREGGRALFRTVPDDADAPAAVRALPEDPAWNGEALRFLVELAAVSREERWVRPVREGIAAWSTRVPADGRGLGELAGAAFRLDAPPPVFLVTGDPHSDEGRRLLGLVLSLHSLAVRLRWVPPGERAEVQRRFGVRFEEAPALYLVRGRSSGALRDADVLAAVWREAAADEGR